MLVLRMESGNLSCKGLPLFFVVIWCDFRRKNENICRILLIYLYISKKNITFAPDLGAETQARVYMCTRIKESNLRRSSLCGRGLEGFKTF